MNVLGGENEDNSSQLTEPMEYPSQPRNEFGESADERPALTCREWLLAIMMFLLTLTINLCFSLLIPFYPQEAVKKGVSHSLIGIIFGVFELAAFIFAPIFGIMMSKVAPKYILTFGGYYGAAVTASYGFLSIVPAGTPFIALSIFLRVLDAIGASAITTSSFTLAAEYFPEYAMTVIGLLETAVGVGLTAGPVFGGALYEAGGFPLPFLVIGVIMLLCAIISSIVLPKDNYVSEKTEDENKASAFCTMIRIFWRPAVIIVCIAIVFSAMCCTYLAPIFTQKLKKFHIGSTTLIGLVYAIFAGTFSISTPLFGIIVDKFPKTSSKWIQVTGSIVLTLSFLFMGPCPLFHLKDTLWLNIVCLAFMGIGAAMIFSPSFALIRADAISMGHPNNTTTVGLVSGFVSASYNLGGFIGPTVAGAVSDAVGIPWSLSILGFSVLALTILLTSYYTFVTCREQRSQLVETGSVEEKVSPVNCNGLVHRETSPINQDPPPGYSTQSDYNEKMSAK